MHTTKILLWSSAASSFQLFLIKHVPIERNVAGHIEKNENGQLFSAKK